MAFAAHEQVTPAQIAPHGTPPSYIYGTISEKLPESAEKRGQKYIIRKHAGTAMTPRNRSVGQPTAKQLAKLLRQLHLRVEAAIASALRSSSLPRGSVVCQSAAASRDVPGATCIVPIDHAARDRDRF
jgi:hypothetical protein